MGVRDTVVFLTGLPPAVRYRFAFGAGRSFE
jgi:hypothetical protein